MSNNSASATTTHAQTAVADSTEQDERPTAAELLVGCVKEYARERPEGVAIWAFGIGFIVGWKLKPW